VVQFLEGACVVVKIIVANGRCFKFSDLFVPFQEIPSFKYVVKQFFWVVGALICLSELKILILAENLVEPTLVKILHPSVNQIRRLVQTARLQVYKHVGNHGKEDQRTNKVCPYIHCLVVEHKQRADAIPIVMEKNPIAR